MRRQARPAGGGARHGRSASALQVWLWLLIFVFQNEVSASQSIQPGYLDFDNLPETNFTCEGKVIGGYYADLETSCQMFHVCTVGQQDEPMDIKFLCLNGTVFDQETRVCERVDEVDCTKSEKFYSLNLELYGSTIAPPTIKTDQTKPQSTDEPHDVTKSGDDIESDPSIDDPPKIHSHKVESNPEYQDTTEDPVQEISKTDPTNKPHDYTSIQPMNPAHLEPVEENQEEEEIDSELPEYEDDYTQPTLTTQAAPPTTTPLPTTTPAPAPPTPHPQIASSPTPTYSSISVPSNSPSPAKPTHDPALLSPQEFIYRHRGPGSEAISFQRQGFRPADGVYITHAPPQQFDHFQYESSRTAPRPSAPHPPAPHPVPFVKRPPPAPFRATTLDPRDQILRPGPSSQSSERHETSVDRRPYPSPLPAQRPLPFDPYYYDRKRSNNAPNENESTLAARSVGPPVIAERPPPKPKSPKSPPRVIVTASASVSDSNGKRLNYTVGNVVSAVKPIVNINYDDYKESDLIFDPFFLDVPKLQKRRKSRGSRGPVRRNIFAVPATAAAFFDMRDEGKVTTTSRVTSQATTTEKTALTSTTASTTTHAWNPNDYVDDNYEPHAYIPPVHPLAVLMPFDRSKLKKENQSHNDLVDKKHYHKKLLIRVEESTSLPAQSTSSQRAPEAAPPAPAAPPALHVQPLCAHASSSDCRTRA